MHRIRRSLAPLAALALLVALTGCSRMLSTSPDSTTAPIAGSGKSGAGDAGVISVPPLPSADSLLRNVVWYPVKSLLVTQGTDVVVSGSRYRLHFFKNSLDADQLITIQEYDANRADVTFGPHGIKFVTPVELTVDFSGTTYDVAPTRDDVAEPALFYWNEDTQRWEELAGKVDWSRRTVTVYLEHFSRYALGSKAGWKHQPNRAEE